MSTYSDLIEAIKARVDTVPDVGITHAYQRFSYHMPDYLDHFMVSIDGVDQIRGWVVTMAATDPIATEIVAQGALLQRTYNCEIYGVLGLSDESESEVTFFDLAEAILNAIEGRVDLGVTGVYNVDAVSLRAYQIRPFGNVLCHYCEIIVPVHVDVEVSYAAG